MTWQILEGKNTIPVCLMEAVDEVDAGLIIFRDELRFEGSELNGELREAQAKMTSALCKRFLDAQVLPEGQRQQGEATSYPRRRPKDSRLDPERTIAEQFSLLRVVDNERYPAFFELNGTSYELKITKRNGKHDQ